jgi:hypothetical protein
LCPCIARAIGGLLRQRKCGKLSASVACDRVASEYDIHRTARLLDDILNRTVSKASKDMRG